MPFLGKTPTVGNFILLDSITVSNTATFALTKDSLDYYPGSAQNMIVSVNGVTQAPLTAYTITDNNIIFASALDSDVDVIDYILVLGDTLNIGRPSDSTVGATQLQDYAVTSVKMSNTGVGAATYGTSTSIPQITIDAAGRITSATGIDRSNQFEDLTVTGNLTVSGNTVTVDAQTLSVEDPLIHLASNNETSDVVDIGFVGHYSNDGGTTKLHTGFFRDASDEQYYLFNGFEDDTLDLSSPSTTIDRTANTFTLADLNVGNFTSTGIDDNATSTTITIDSSQNVGIGTSTTPRGRLDIKDSYNGIFIGDGTHTASNTNAEFIQFSRTTSAADLASIGVEEGAQGRLMISSREGVIFNVGGGVGWEETSEVARIDASGNLGIGTTNPTRLLDIQGVGGLSASPSVTATTGTNYIGWRLSNSGGTFWTAIDNSVGSAFGTNTAYARVFWGGSGAYPFVFMPNGTERMRIDSSGNVIIGSSTANASDAVTLRQDGTAHVNNAQFSNGNGSVGGTTPCIYSPASATMAISTNSTERMRITGTGNVGIGETNPTAKLHISVSDHTQGVDGRTIRLDNDTTGRFAVIGNDDSQNMYFWNGTNNGTGVIQFITGGGSGTERMRIDSSSGNVGIGETNPTAVHGGKALQVSSTTGAEVIVHRDDGGVSTGDYVGGFLFYNGDASGSPPHYAGMIGRAGNIYGSTNLQFYAGRTTLEDYVNQTPHMIIAAPTAETPSVGINVSSPGAKLHLRHSTDSDYGLIVQRNSATGRAQILLQDENGTNLWRTGGTGGGASSYAFFDGTRNALVIGSSVEATGVQYGGNQNGVASTLAGAKTISTSGTWVDIAYVHHTHNITIQGVLTASGGGSPNGGYARTMTIQTIYGNDGATSLSTHGYGSNITNLEFRYLNSGGSRSYIIQARATFTTVTNPQLEYVISGYSEQAMERI